MSDINCNSCGATCEAGSRFCTSCGATMEPAAHCDACNHPNPVSSRFCGGCGGELRGGAWRTDGVVTGAVDRGEWERLPEEFIRRVHRDDMRRVLGNRSMRVPVGSVGVVVVDGLVTELLPPGRQTTLNLFERIAGFFTGQTERTAFYLVDLRPVPVPFTVKTQRDAGGAEIQTQVLASMRLDRSDRAGIARFIERVLGAAPAYTSNDLFTLLRPEVTRVARAAIERLAARGDLDYAAAEAAIQRELGASIPGEYGLGVRVRVAPLTTTVSLDLHLGGEPAGMDTRLCGSCSTALPASMAFCDHCGHKQTPLPQSARLVTSDGQDVEIDLVVRVQGQHESIDAEVLREPVTAAVTAHLRTSTWAELASADGFRGLELSASPPLKQLLAARGLSLVLVSVVDVRSKTEAWLLGARADLSRAQSEMLVGREWIQQHTADLDVGELALELALARQRQERQQRLRERQLERDTAFAGDRAELADRQRRQDLEEGRARLDVADASRGARVGLEVDRAERETERTLRAEDRLDQRAEQAHSHTLAAADTGHAADLERTAMQLDADRARQEISLGSERARASAEDAVMAERARRDVAFDDDARRTHLNSEQADRAEERQVEKLRAMAEIEHGMLAQEQAHEAQMRESLKGLSEREMIAAQATELAKTEGGGAAWARALEGQGASDELRARLEDKDRHAEQLLSVMERAAKLGEGAANQGVYEKSMDAMSKVASSRATPGPAAPCDTCGAPLRPGAQFCGACGAAG